MKKKDSKNDLLKKMAAIPPMGFQGQSTSANMIREAMQKTADQVAKNMHITKTASTGSGMGSGSPFVARAPLLYVDPMFDPILFLFPKDRIDEINKRLRHYYETDPIVGSSIDMHCLPLGEPVFCNGSIKEIQDIVIGDSVVGKEGKVVKVIDTESVQYDGDLFEIKPIYLPSIKVTDIHPIMAIPKDAIMYDSHGTPVKTDVNNPSFSKAKWIMAKSIKEGDVVMFPKFKEVVEADPIDLTKFIKLNNRYSYNSKEILTFQGKREIGRCSRYLPITKEFSELLGWYVAEGSTFCATITFSLGTHEIDRIERIKYLIESVFGLKVSIYNKNNNGTQVTCFSKVIADMLNAICGVGSENKKISTEIMFGNIDNAQSFLSSYLQGDGCLNLNNDSYTVICNTVSKTLANQLLLLGSKCNILFGYSEPSHGVRNGKKQLYQLSAHKSVIFPLIGKVYDGKINKFYHQDDSYFYLKITSVNKTKFLGIVYDIKTEDESFCAPFLIHNSAFPLSDFSLECENTEHQKFWNDWKDRVGLLETMREITHDYWLLGEGMALPIWDTYSNEISHFNQYPPENVDIIQTYVTPKKFFLLKPDPKLSEKVKSDNAADRSLMAMMDSEYIESLKNGQPYLLGDSDKVMYLARTTTKYRSRGVSILARCLKDLLYKDKLRLLQLTFVDRHLFPLKVFKLGSESKGWIPNKEHFARLQALLGQAANDPDFNLIWHFGLQVDYVGTKDKIANLIPEFEWVEKQVMAALFVNEEIVHGGLPSAVRDTVNMRTLTQRYMDLREKLERMLITHIFLPMARARHMYRKGYEDKVKQMERKALDYAKQKNIKVNGSMTSWNTFKKANLDLDLSAFDIPRPIWKKINLVNNASEQQLLLNLEQDGKLPLSMVFDMLGIDPKVVAQKLKEQESTMFDSLYRKIREDYGQSDKIKEQILAGKKVKEWTKEKGETIEGGGGAISGGGMGGGSMDFGGGGGMPEIEKKPIEVETPTEAPHEIVELPEMAETPEAPIEAGGGE